MKLQGIIDLGSNSIRLVVYEVKSPSKHAEEARHFKSIMDEKKIAGLSAYVHEGVFSREGIEVAIATLQRHIKAARNIGCEDVRIFATAVIRNCINSYKAAERISKDVGIEVEVLSAEDEAHLGFVGAVYANPMQSGTLIDIGGGSTELTSIREGKDCVNLSLPQGSVSSYAQYVEMIFPRPEEIDKIREAFVAQLDGIADKEEFNTHHLYGIGGSVRAIDKLYASAFANNNKPGTLAQYQLDAFENLLVERPDVFAHACTRAVPDRVHTVVPGLVIVQQLMNSLGADHLTICKYGIREGFLLERVLGV